MSEFSIDVDGLDAVRDRLEELEDDLTSAAKFEVGAGAEYAVFLEFGTEDMPPYPFFRPAIREFRATPEAFVVTNTGFNDLTEIESADELVRAVARALESQIKTNATASATDRSPGTDPDHPQVDTGNLRASIQAIRVS